LSFNQFQCFTACFRFWLQPVPASLWFSHDIGLKGEDHDEGLEQEKFEADRLTLRANQLLLRPW
jgi:hypothetical protein